MDELVSNPNITPSDYKSLYLLFVIDVSEQRERLKISTTDNYIRAQFGTDHTQTFVMVISDRLLSFQSDGNKFSLVY